MSYWDSFLGSNHTLNLIWSVKNDYSPKVRLIAATALSCYLEHAKAFFMITAAEDISHSFNSINSHHHVNPSSSFLPISYTISSLIRQLHKDLLNSLCKRETFNLNLVQLLKCLNSLIKATPYQKLKPGMVLKLVTTLNFLLLKHNQTQNRSFNVLTEIFNCFQILLNTHHELAEMHLALVSPLPTNLMTKTAAIGLNDEDSNLSMKLESFKIPSISQSRVTYFYEGNAFSSSSYTSNSVSGNMTPSSNTFTHDTDAMSGKSWLVNFCIENASNHHQNLPISSCCMDLLLIICKRYFDLLRRDLFFDQITQLILKNIDMRPTQLLSANIGSLQDTQLVDQFKLKNLKLFEEFARSLATNEIRSMNGIDLNDCCKFW